MHHYIKGLRASVAAFDDVAESIRTAAKAQREKIQASTPAAKLAGDNLTTIGGIGPAVASRLSAADLRTYAALAVATDSKLEDITKGYSRIAIAKEWRQQAGVAASIMGQDYEPDLPQVSDRLTEIGGIGPSTAKAFINAGIHTFQALATMSGSDLEAPASSAEHITATDIWCLLNADRTDLGNTDRMLLRYGHRILDVVGLGVMAWTGNRWVNDGKEGALERTAHAAAREIGRDMATAQMLNEYRPDLLKYLPLTRTEAKIMREGDRERRGMVEDPENVRFSMEDLSKFASQSQSQKAVSAMVKQSRAYMQVDADRMDALPHIMGVRNGMIDLRNGTLLPADPSALLSKQAAAHYDAAAQCPNWLAFLKDVFDGDAALIAYLQRWIGYILTGETREQKFLFLTGQGSNGKGVLTFVIERLMADYAKTLTKDYLMKQRGIRSKASGTDDLLAGIRGARYVHASEGDADDALDEGRMKDLSGEGIQIASFKFERAFEFRPVAKLVFDTNFRPRIHSQDNAIWRRVVNIVFKNHYEHPDHEDFVPGVSKPKDPKLREMLLQELPGVLAWAVRGAVIWYTDGLGEEPESVRNARAGYRVETDATGDFMDQCIVVRQDAWVQAGMVYKAYKEWVEYNAVGNAISARAFGDILREKGYRSEKRGGTIIRYGLKLSRIGEAYAARASLPGTARRSSPPRGA